MSRADMFVRPKRFSQHVRGLARLGYVGITAGAWLDHLENGTPLPPRPVIFTFDDGYAELADHAFPVLERHGFGAVVFLVTDLVGGTAAWTQEPELVASELMDEGTIREWAARGIEFAAHTRTHPDLKAIPHAQMEDEVRRSREDVARIAGIPTRCFAYPYGRYNDDVLGQVRGAYACAFSVRHGIADFAEDPFRLQRMVVWRDDRWLEIGLGLRAGWLPRARLRRARKELPRTLYVMAADIANATVRRNRRGKRPSARS